MAVVTDLGTYDDALVSKLQNLDGLLLEANHDINMLQTGAYPYPLKRRIMGDSGHLSNERSGQLLCELLHDKFGSVILGHLSKEKQLRKSWLMKPSGLRSQWETIHIRQVISLCMW